MSPQFWTRHHQCHFSVTESDLAMQLECCQTEVEFVRKRLKQMEEKLETERKTRQQLDTQVRQDVNSGGPTGGLQAVDPQICPVMAALLWVWFHTWHPFKTPDWPYALVLPTLTPCVCDHNDLICVGVCRWQRCRPSWNSPGGVWLIWSGTVAGWPLTSKTLVSSQTACRAESTT